MPDSVFYSVETEVNIYSLVWICKKQHLEPCTEQLIGSRLRKVYDEPVYYHPVYLTYAQSTSCKILG